MTLDSFNQELEELKRSIEKKIEHSYLDQYIDAPKIDHYKLFVLYSILNETSLSKETIRHYIVSTMLVQIALDTHELVPSTNETSLSRQDQKSKQLLVLAGDYYSGLYYLLLSEIEEISMIHILASAIKEINELKMKLYYNEVNSFKEYVQLMKQIDSLLIVRVVEAFTNFNIKPFIEDIFITCKLIEEKLSLYKTGCSKIFNNFLTNGHFTSVLQQIKIGIREHTHNIEHYLMHSPFKQLLNSLHFDKLISEFIYDHEAYVEEG